MAARDRLDVFSLAAADGEETSFLKRWRFPAFFGVLGVATIASVMPLFGGLSWSGGAIALGLTGFTAFADLLAKRRWAPIRHRMANAVLNDGRRDIGPDLAPAERDAAKAAVREFRRLPEKKLTWKETLGEAGVWPLYFLTMHSDDGFLSTPALLASAAVFFAVQGAQAGYRADVLRPVLARIAREQLAKIEAATADESAPAPKQAQDSTPTAEQRKAAKGIAVAQ